MRACSAGARAPAPPQRCHAQLGAGSCTPRCPVLVLPGFLSNATTSPGSQYSELAANLRARGHAVDVLPAHTRDWLPTLRGGSFAWFLERTAEHVARLADTHGGPVGLVGISAGGWLARLALAAVPYEGRVWGLGPSVSALVTCGSPHLSAEAYPFGRAEEGWIRATGCAPKGVTTSLQWANHHLPDAASLAPVRVLCVAGAAAKGEAFGWSNVRAVLSGRLALSEAGNRLFVQSSYVANCGRVDVDGDGVCPVETALLPGAEALVLPGVFHDAAKGRRWYGSADVVELWAGWLT
ncbi:hypothetical protein HT031_004803 [Scenedesmus sp. PABB004]|nr:hypothetical protein HT031_004803 [Scenedesmus sp. PABB004]